MQKIVRLDFDVTIKNCCYETTVHQFIEGENEMELRTWLEEWKHSHPSSKVTNITVKKEKKNEKN